MLVLSILFLFFHHADIYIFPPATSAVFRSTSASTRSHAAQSLFRRWCLFVGYSLSFSLPLRYRSIRCCALAYYSSLPQHEQFLPPQIWHQVSHAKRETCVNFLFTAESDLPIVIIIPFWIFFLVRNGFFWYCCEVWEGNEVFDFVSKHPPCGICPLHLLEWGDLPFEGHLFLCIILLWCALSCLSSSSLRAREKEEEGGVGGWN